MGLTKNYFRGRKGQSKYAHLSVMSIKNHITLIFISENTSPDFHLVKGPSEKQKR